jgi:hypothetical protein
MVSQGAELWETIKQARFQQPSLCGTSHLIFVLVLQATNCTCLLTDCLTNARQWPSRTESNWLPVNPAHSGLLLKCVHQLSISGHQLFNVYQHSERSAQKLCHISLITITSCHLHCCLLLLSLFHKMTSRSAETRRPSRRSCIQNASTARSSHYWEQLDHVVIRTSEYLQFTSRTDLSVYGRNLSTAACWHSRRSCTKQHALRHKHKHKSLTSVYYKKLSSTNIFQLYVKCIWHIIGI